ncbi:MULTISPECIES: hypothetical protein [Microbacterium]|uniref:hypothetical protein n=1 Tax=Microbacterium TaxID=33882 RepID=UPI00217D6A55|nr:MULTISPECIES: hypothetical protein [Microbacterium]UWF78216.1 hypothetical protein JSY13_04105 [Microbacterium neungamense]WCM56388.1 hypothetical protein JRG78_04110 [Microbacterium sp. EF45047]
MIRKTIATAGLTAVLVLAGTGVASAHECYIPDRSAQGNTNATHSGNWETLELAGLFATAHEFLGGPALTPAQVDYALGLAEEQGIPLSLTTFLRDTLPKGKAPAEHSSDGKGIDHFFATYEGQLVSIFFEAQAHMG